MAVLAVIGAARWIRLRERAASRSRSWRCCPGAHVRLGARAEYADRALPMGRGHRVFARFFPFFLFFLAMFAAVGWMLVAGAASG